jgi:hypothetical protein
MRDAHSGGMEVVQMKSGVLMWLALSVAGCAQGQMETSADESALADDGEAGHPPPPHCHGPPPEALAACEGKAAGEACTVDLEGECRTPPWDDTAPAACVPPHPADRNREAE